MKRNRRVVLDRGTSGCYSHNLRLSNDGRAPALMTHNIARVVDAERQVSGRKIAHGQYSALEGPSLDLAIGEGCHPTRWLVSLLRRRGLHILRVDHLLGFCSDCRVHPSRSSKTSQVSCSNSGLSV